MGKIFLLDHSKETAMSHDDGSDNPEFQKWKRLQTDTISWMLAVPSGKLGYDLYKGGLLGERERALQTSLRKRYEGAREDWDTACEKSRTAKEKAKQEMQDFIEEEDTAEEGKDGDCHAWMPESVIEKQCALGNALICSVCHKEVKPSGGSWAS